MKNIIITESEFEKLIGTITQKIKDLKNKSGSNSDLSLLKRIEKIFSSKKEPETSGDDDSDIEKFFKSLKGGGDNQNDDISFSSSSDDEMYKKILSGIGAPATKENMKFFYAFRQSEGAKATYNPFNTTQPYNGASKYNKAGVRNYKSEQDGVNATVKTFKNGLYECIVNGLKNDIGAKKISTKCISNLQTWKGDAGGLIEKILNSGNLNPPPIQRTFVKKI